MHRVLEPGRSCLKVTSALDANIEPRRAGITIKQTPEKMIISPRSEMSRELFYSDDDYARFHREAMSLRWLLDGATTPEAELAYRKSLGTDEEARPRASSPPREAAPRTDAHDMQASPPPCSDEDDHVRDRGADRSPLHSPPIAPVQKRAILGVSSVVSSRAKPESSAGGGGERKTRLQLEIESLSMHDLKDKIKVCSASASAVRPMQRLHIA